MQPRLNIIIFSRSISQNETGGVALILVVWIMVVLIAIAGEFSYSMRTETNIARNFKEEEEAYQLALAGIEQAKLEILSAKNNDVVSYNKDNVLVFGNDEKEDKKDDEKEGVEGTARKDDLGNGSFEYVITDEDGKININTEPLEKLKYVFLETDIDSAEADTIVDSIIDWRDPNDLHMLNGAEEDYYQSLEQPYSCKDGPFDSLEELLLVKGMKEEYLYGSKEEDDEGNFYKGVEKHLTVYGSGKININTASDLALEAVFGADVAANIKTQRETGPILTPVQNGKVSSEIFTIVSTGTGADGTIKRSVKMVVRKKDKELETLYWNDNFI